MMRVYKKGAPPEDVGVRLVRSLFVSRGSLFLCHGSGFGFGVKFDEVSTCANLEVSPTLGKARQGTTEVLFP